MNTAAYARQRAEKFRQFCKKSLSVTTFVFGLRSALKQKHLDKNFCISYLTRDRLFKGCIDRLTGSLQRLSLVRIPMVKKFVETAVGAL